MKPSDSISKVPLVGPIYQRRLKKIGIKNVEDLILHIPHRYEDYRKISDLTKIKIGDSITIQGEVNLIRNQYTRTGKKIQIVEVGTGQKKATAIWFNQPYLVRSFKKGETISLSGKIDWFGKKRALISPQFEKIIPGIPLIHTARIIPIYPETAGVSSKWLRRRIMDIFKLGIKFKEFLPEEIRKRSNLLEINDAIHKVHFPESLEEAQKARNRLALNELLVLQAQNILRRNNWQDKKVNFKLKINEKEIQDFIASIPFKLTKSQEESIFEILEDIKKDYPMNRLLQGDVGSGKTVVAAVAAFAAFSNGYQSTFMAPTQILVEQHFNTLNQLFEPFRARISLITSSGIKSGPGKSDIIIGTHALLYNKTEISNSVLVVIDEQHKFGVEQRAHISQIASKRGALPHILTMTATPIPRTVALTFYGDLSLSTLKELPGGRKPVVTWIVPPEKKENAYHWIEEKIIKEGIQAFVVCPLIEESEVEGMKQVKAATAEFQKLKKLLPKLKIGLLHGRLKSAEKEKVIGDFRKKALDILVSTPVVEVGIDVPNAAIIVIEAAERFGLAQLHQLRGRVGRGDKKSYCLLFTDTKSKKAQKRLYHLKETTSGFELAEIDLRLRGPGEIFGLKQHGIPELKIASWQDIDLIKKSKKLTEEIFSYPQKHKKIIDYFKSKQVSAN